MSNHFRYGTGILGSTEPGQKVTAKNASELPEGSVVMLGDGSRLIRLHDDFWLWCCDSGHCYDTLANHAWRIDKHATVCHLAPNKNNQ